MNLNPSATFIPDPGRWAVVAVDWYAVFDVLGWRYDPVADTSEPVVSTRKYGGARSIDRAAHPGFYILVRRWEGIAFGGGYPWQPSVPQGISVDVEGARAAWEALVIEETDALARSVDCGCLPDHGGRP